MIDERRDRKINLVDEKEFNAREKKAIETYIKGLPVPKKIELATRGNKQVRSILAKDHNNQVARAVASGPRLTDDELISFAQSSNVNEEVLKYIADNSQMTKNKRVVIALCNNPRTPAGMVIRFLPRLDLRELKSLSTNRNVSSAVRAQAKIVLRFKSR